jgi:hypothetical protein
MKSVDANTSFADILLKIIHSTPVGYIFDSLYIIERLSDEYPARYSAFLALFGESQNPNDMAAEEIERMLNICDPAFVQEINLKVHMTTISDNLSSRRLWKKI